MFKLLYLLDTLPNLQLASPQLRSRRPSCQVGLTLWIHLHWTWMLEPLSSAYRVLWVASRALAVLLRWTSFSAPPRTLYLLLVSDQDLFTPQVSWQMFSYVLKHTPAACVFSNWQPAHASIGKYGCLPLWSLHLLAQAPANQQGNIYYLIPLFLWPPLNLRSQRFYHSLGRELCWFWYS